VAAWLDDDVVHWATWRTFADVLAAHPAATVAVDIPIGITDAPRACDRAARQYLARFGAAPSSVFDAPTAAAVAAFEAGRSHAEAMAGRGSGRGVSIQAWNLIPKIVDVRDALAGPSGSSGSPADVVEAHPECSFRALAPDIGGSRKKTARGAGRRLRALQREFTVDLGEAPESVPVDDVLDATVLIPTAQRWASGQALVLPQGAAAAPRIVV
jgi:predicted RNase H-like nuclease